MKLLKDQNGAATTEYALVSLVTVGLLVLLVQAAHANILNDYLDRVIRAFLIRPLSGLEDLSSELMKISRY